MNPAPAGTLFDEITDFLLSQPTATQMLEYQVSEPLDTRLHELLERNSQVRLSFEEQKELDTFLQFAHIITLLKAKALEKLDNEE